jgi:CheY-like chemotaxis protein
MMRDMNERPVVAAVADLLFGARIRAAAAEAGRSVQFARSVDALVDAAAGASLLLLDLDARWLDAAAVIGRLKNDTPTAAVPIIAFVSHVRTDAIEAARAAGADRVLARSAFVRDLPKLLRQE